MGSKEYKLQELSSYLVINHDKQKSQPGLLGKNFEK